MHGAHYAVLCVSWLIALLVAVVPERAQAVEELDRSKVFDAIGQHCFKDADLAYKIGSNP